MNIDSLVLYYAFMECITSWWIVCGVADENGKKKRPQNLRITPYPRFSIGVIAPDNLCNMQQRLDTLR